MIEKIRDYIATCDLLDQYAELNVNYLVDKTVAYSINEESSYTPLLEESITGTKIMQLRFDLDSRFVWNEDLSNNIANSKFFENFSEWLEEKNNQGEYPDIPGITPISISANTNGFIFAADTNEAIYRISCVFTYYKENTTQESV